MTFLKDFSDCEVKSAIAAHINHLSLWGNFCITHGKAAQKNAIIEKEPMRRQWYDDWLRYNITQCSAIR